MNVNKDVRMYYKPFFQRGQWLARAPLNICGNAISRTFIIQIISQGFTWEGRAIPIRNSDLVFFQILQIAVSSELTSSLIAKKTLNDKREKWGRGASAALWQCHMDMGSSTGPNRLGGWKQSQGHVICFPQRATKVFLLPNGGQIPQQLPLGWIWSSFKQLLCVQNLSKFAWVLPVTEIWVPSEWKEAITEDNLSSRSDVRPAHLNSRFRCQLPREPSLWLCSTW